MATTAGTLIIEIKGDITNIKKSLTQVQGDLNQLKKNSDKTSSAFGDLKNQLGNVSGVMTLLRGGMVATALYMGKEFIENIGKTQEAFQSFNLVIGHTSEDLLADLREAAQGTVSDLDLMKNSVYAVQLGISKSQLPELVSTARALGKVMGRDTTQAFQDLSIGIGRQSRLILDNLGLIIDLDKAYATFAKAQGKNVAALSEGEKKQALLNEAIKTSIELQKALEFTGRSSADEFKKAWVPIANLWNDIKNGIGGAMTTQAMMNEAQAQGVTINWDMYNAAKAVAGAYEEQYQKVVSLQQAQASALESIRGFSVGNYTTPEEQRLSRRGLGFEGEEIKAKKKLFDLKRLAAQAGVPEGISSSADFYKQMPKGRIVTEEQKLILSQLDDQNRILKDIKTDQEENNLLLEEEKHKKESIQFTMEGIQKALDNQFKTMDEIKEISNSITTNYMQITSDLKQETDYLTTMESTLNKISEKIYTTNLDVVVRYRSYGKNPSWYNPDPDEQLQGDLNGK